jgi:site-specific DNA-methyltransferase (adenine-specific)
VLCHGVGGINVDGCGIPGDGASRFPSNLLIDDIVAAELDQSGGRRPPSRYFYCAKPTLEERQAGVDGENLHPCVKPVALMRWLVRLVTPPNGLVLDPFAGTGSTGVAALAEKRQFIGVEKDPEYARIASQRMA